MAGAPVPDRPTFTTRFHGSRSLVHAEVVIRTRKGGKMRPRYWGWPAFGRAASSERFAIHASYSGVPRRGGVPSGKPPIHDGMSAMCSPAVLPPAQPDSNRLDSNSTNGVRIAFR
jgi:hypothetical protein